MKECLYCGNCDLLPKLLEIYGTDDTFRFCGIHGSHAESTCPVIEYKDALRKLVSLSPGTDAADGPDG